MSQVDCAVIFDLDGTLLDTLQDLSDSGNAVLAARGFPKHSINDYRTFIGTGMENLVRAIFPEGERPETDEEIAEVLAQYRGFYSENWKNTTVPYPGIPELLDTLTGRGIPIGVLSNKAHDFTVKCVDEFLGQWKWDIVLGQREGSPRKPDPSGALEIAETVGVAPENCYFIGDSDVDMFTAKNAEMHAIGVAWGFRGTKELLSAGAEKVLQSPKDLLNATGTVRRLPPRPSESKS